MTLPVHTVWYCGTFNDSVHHIRCSQQCTVYPKKYAHGFVVLCFVVVMQSFIMNSHEVYIHIHQGCFAGTGAIVRLPQCQWSKPDGYGKISQCITTTKHSKAKTVCIFLGIYCNKQRSRFVVLGCNRRIISYYLLLKKQYRPMSTLWTPIDLFNCLNDTMYHARNYLFMAYGLL